MTAQQNNVSSTDPPQAAPEGFRLGPVLAATLYLLLVASAAVALGTRRFPGVLPKALELIGPALFFMFLVCFTLYRWALVRAKRYPAPKAFFQVGAAALFFTLLLPAAKKEYEPREDEIEMLLSDNNPKVRALAAEVIGHRPDGAKYGRQLVKALTDPDPRVRERAHQSLVRLAGEDLGPGGTQAEIEAWSNRFR